MFPVTTNSIIGSTCKYNTVIIQLSNRKVYFDTVLSPNLNLFNMIAARTPSKQWLHLTFLWNENWCTGKQNYYQANNIIRKHP